MLNNARVCPYSEPNEFFLHHLHYLFKTGFNIVHLSTAGSSK
jgi:hypothetical protein